MKTIIGFLLLIFLATIIAGQQFDAHEEPDYFNYFDDEMEPEGGEEHWPELDDEIEAREEEYYRRRRQTLINRFSERVFATREPSPDCPERCTCHSPEEVHCNFKFLTKVPTGVPKGVEKMNLGYNKLRVLPGRTFEKHGDTLRFLYLHSNDIRSLNNAVFSKLKNVEVLRLSWNKLTGIRKVALHGLLGLQRLYLDNNHLTFIHPLAFRGLANLESLQLDGNRLSRLHEDVFLTLQFQKYFKFSSIQYLYLSKNAFENLPEKLFENMARLRRVNLHANEWDCTCELKWLKIWMNGGKSRCKRNSWNPRKPEECARCGGPPRLKGVRLQDISTYNLTCEAPSRTVRIGPEPAIRYITDLEEVARQDERAFLHHSGFFSVRMNLRLDSYRRSVFHANCNLTRVPVVKVTEVFENGEEPPTGPPTEITDPRTFDASFESEMRCVVEYPEDFSTLQTHLGPYLDREMNLTLRVTKPSPLGKPQSEYSVSAVETAENQRIPITGASISSDDEFIRSPASVLTFRSKNISPEERSINLAFLTSFTHTYTPKVGLFNKQAWALIKRSEPTGLSMEMALERRTVSLKCRAVGQPKPEIIWVLPGNKVMRRGETDGRFSVTRSGRLFIRRSIPDDSGVYRCIAAVTKEPGEAAYAEMSSIKVDVFSRTKDSEGILSQIRIETVDEGDEWSSECNVEGLPNVTMSWITPANQLISTGGKGRNDRVMMTKTGRIIVKKFVKTDQGIYRCVASNILGTAEYTTYVGMRSTDNEKIETIVIPLQVSEYDDYDDEVAIPPITLPTSRSTTQRPGGKPTTPYTTTLPWTSTNYKTDRTVPDRTRKSKTTTTRPAITQNRGSSQDHDDTGSKSSEEIGVDTPPERPSITDQSTPDVRANSGDTGNGGHAKTEETPEDTPPKRPPTIDQSAPKGKVTSGDSNGRHETPEDTPPKRPPAIDQSTPNGKVTSGDANGRHEAPEDTPPKRPPAIDQSTPTRKVTSGDSNGRHETPEYIPSKRPPAIDQSTPNGKVTSGDADGRHETAESPGGDTPPKHPLTVDQQGGPTEDAGVDTPPERPPIVRPKPEKADLDNDQQTNWTTASVNSENQSSNDQIDATESVESEVLDSREEEDGHRLDVIESPEDLDISPSIISPPTISDFPSDPVTVKLGGTVTIPCNAAGSPGLELTWRRKGYTRDVSSVPRAPTFDSIEVPSVVFVHKSAHANGRLSLIINGATASDSGLYVCTASNSAGTSTKEVRVTVGIQEPAEERVELTVPDVRVGCGGKVAIPCTLVPKFPASLVLWTTPDGSQIPISSTGGDGVAVFRNATLFLSRATPSHDGTYKCEIKNPLGTAFMVVDVTVGCTLPRIIEPTESRLIADYGASVEVACHATGTPQPTVMWTSMGDLDADKSVLHLDQVTESMTRTCIASNIAGNTTFDLQISVRAMKPRIGRDLPASASALEGLRARLDCAAEGIPKPRFSWYHSNGSAINTENGVFIPTANGSLIMPEVTEALEGDYKCVAWNELGQDEMTVTLVVTQPYLPSPRVGIPDPGLDTGDVLDILPVDKPEHPTEPSMQLEDLPSPKYDSEFTDTPPFQSREPVIVEVDVKQRITIPAFPPSPHLVPPNEPETTQPLKSTGDPNTATPTKTEGEAPTTEEEGGQSDLAPGKTREPTLPAYLPPSRTYLAPTTGMRSSSSDVTITRTRTMQANFNFNMPASRLYRPTTLYHPAGYIGPNDFDADDRYLYRPPQNNRRIYKHTQRIVRGFHGTQLSLPCVNFDPRPTAGSVNPPITFEWTFPSGTSFGYPFSPTSGQQYRIHRNGTLVIRSPVPTDAGIYTCSASDRNENIDYETTISLRVESQRPHMLERSREYLLPKSMQPVSMACTALGHPEPTVTWTTPDGAVLNTASWNEEMTVLRNGTLYIPNILPKMSGRFICKAANVLGQRQRSVLVHVTSYRPQIQKDDRNQQKNVRVGGNIRLRCVASGSPPPTFSWILPSREKVVKNQAIFRGHNRSPKYAVLSSGTLVINRAEYSDAGTYLCSAENKFGRDVLWVPLQVYG